MKIKLPVKAGLKLLFGIVLAAFSMCLASNSFAAPFSYIQNNPDGSQTLTGHKLNFQARFLNHASQYINGQIILPLTNQSQLTTLIQNLYNPKSPLFHQFLTPTQFAQAFGASTSDAAFVQEYLKNQGIYVIGQSPNGTVLNVTGSVPAFEKAFGLQINNYQNADGIAFYAPTIDPTIPASLAGKILAIGGLDNIPKYQAHFQQFAAASPKAAGSGPEGFLAPNDVKTVYNLNSVPSTGTGQNVALFELDGYAAGDITAYEKNFGLPNVPLVNTYVDGFSGKPDCTVGQKNCTDEGSAEVTLDIELVAAFAPGSSVLVYEAPNTTSSWIDEWTRIYTDDKAKVISCSWGEPELDSPTLSFDYNTFQEMSAQGQAVFVAAGDSGAFDAGGKTLAVDEPASQPYVTAVGISKLTTTASGTYTGYTGETASVYGGGGVSAKWSIPAFQTTAASQAVKAAMVSTTMRNLPDVVLTADASTGYAFYINGAWAGYYGSSLSSPIWASFISRVNQGLGKNAPIGSVNPALYSLAQTSGYANDFHDITTGNNGYYPAEPGFDDATGLGSFNGLNLYNDLLKNSVATVVPSVPAGLSAAAGNAQVSLSWTASAGATSYTVYRSTSSSGGFAGLASGILNTTYTDSTVTNGTTYYYEVTAVNSAGASAPTTVVSAKPVAPAAPAAPGNLTGSVSSPGRNPVIVLQWKQSSSPNIKYNDIYYSVGSSINYINIGNVPATTAVNVTGATPGVTYNFYVTAVNSSGVQSPASNKISIVG